MGVCVGHGYCALQRLKLVALVLAIVLGLLAKGTAGDPAVLEAGMVSPAVENVQQRL